MDSYLATGSGANQSVAVDFKNSFRGVGQGHVHHEAPLIIIILNVVLLPFGGDILYKDDFTRSFYNHFHHQQQKNGHPMPLSLKLYFSTMALLFLTKVTSF